MQAAFLNGSFLHMIFYGHNTTKQAEIQDWYIYFYSVIMTHPLMFTYYCSARCFRAECAKIPKFEGSVKSVYGKGNFRRIAGARRCMMSAELTRAWQQEYSWHS